MPGSPDTRGEEEEKEDEEQRNGGEGNDFPMHEVVGVTVGDLKYFMIMSISCVWSGARVKAGGSGR